MPLNSLTITDFRCLEAAEIAADPHFNLIFGANASGKTSVLEAIGYLGRGKSFRGASTRSLIRHGASEFLLHGKVGTEAREVAVGVRNSRDGLQVSINGDRDGGAAQLAELLPLQVVEPDVQGLISGGPELRRRYLDWIAFHVEPGYLAAWRRFRRVLKQRNAALREGAAERLSFSTACSRRKWRYIPVPHAARRKTVFFGKLLILAVLCRAVVRRGSASSQASARKGFEEGNKVSGHRHTRSDARFGLAGLSAPCR